MTVNRQELAAVNCPYCGEPIQLLIDCSVEEQHYIEDCEVCCRPMEINAICDSDGIVDVTVNAEFE